MPRRLPPAVIGVVVLAAFLAACTPSPAENLDEARAWVDAASLGENDRTDVVGSAILSVQPELSEEEANELDELPGITLDFPAPGVRVDGFEVSCHGGGTATFEYEVSAATSSFAYGVEVPCDEDVHDVPVNGESDGVQAVRLNATADTPTYAYVVVVGEAPDDEWAGYFDERAGEFADGGASWGSFGPEGDVVPVGWTDASLPPGAHVVTVECAGPASVSVTLGEADSLPADEHELACPGSASYPFTTESEGISIGMDSHGEPGAYLFVIDAD